jgi:hypothetical protein
MNFQSYVNHMWAFPHSKASIRYFLSPLHRQVSVTLSMSWLQAL